MTNLQALYRLSSIVRYNNKFHIKNETVAEHSYYVAIISMLLADKYQLSDEIKLKCIEKALLHDLPEIEMNDITHDVKEKLDIGEILESFEQKYFSTNFPDYFNLMFNSDEIVSAIVNLADVSSVEQFCSNEIELGNSSKEMKDILSNAKKRLKVCKSKIKEILK